MPEIILYLKIFSNFTEQVKDLIEQSQDRRKQFADKSQREGLQYYYGDHVRAELHPVSKTGQKELPNSVPDVTDSI